MQVEDGGRLGRSDHSIINLVVAAAIPELATGAKRYNWQRADFASIKAELRQRMGQINDSSSFEED
jgi:hypothetical protein